MKYFFNHVHKIHFTLFLGISSIAPAQLVVDNTLTVEQLVNDILLGEGMEASNITFNGLPADQVTVQAAYFNSEASNIPIPTGVLMTTGNVDVAVGPNNSASAWSTLGVTTLDEDSDLSDLDPGNSIGVFNVAKIEFDFTAIADSIKLQYVFASEEYNEYTCYSVNDVFGFFLSGPGLSGPFSNNSVNIALLPGTNIPVSINTVNSGNGMIESYCEALDPNWQENAIYFIDNEFFFNPDVSITQYDGFTVPLKAEAAVQCGETYHIKLAIADVGDHVWDSGVFFQEGSFSASGGGVEGNPVQFVADVYQGCAPLEVSFTNLTDTAFMESVIWSFGSDSSTDFDPVYTFSEPGLHVVTLTVTVVTPEGCEISFTEENVIEVFENPSAEISYEVLGRCEVPFEVAFESQTLPGWDFAWDFGLGGGSEEANPVVTFAEAGDYPVQLEVRNAQTGCTSYSSELLSLSVPAFGLVAPEWICADSLARVEAFFENGTVSWADGIVGATLEITEPGWHEAVFTHENGCELRDSVLVPLKSRPRVTARDKEACAGDVVQLFAESDAAQVYWEGVSDSHVAMVHEGGTYRAVAENVCGTTSVEMEVVLKDCSCEVYIPNSFSPNGDGINDLFRPSVSCPLTYFELRIFDRWGMEVFASNDPGRAWNGDSARNAEYYAGVELYQYILWYDNALVSKHDRQKETGVVQLIR